MHLVNPYIVSSPPSKIEVGSVGDAVTLNCSARGSPLPRVTWFKSGKRVVSTEEDDGSDLLKSGVVIPSSSTVTLGFIPVCFTMTRI